MPTGSTVTGRRRTRALAAATAVLATAVTLGAGTAPASAAPAAPGGLAATSIPVLSWSKVSGATRYEVQVDNDLGFDTPEFTVKTTNTRAVPTKALAGGTQYWRVRALDAGGASSDWSQGEFEMAAIDVPSGLTPDGAVLPQPQDPPVLAWTGIQGATSYIVELDTDNDFIGATSATTQTTSLVWPTPLEAGDYWWRVTASKGSGLVSEPSAEATFTIQPLDPVVLTSPEDNPDTEVEDVVLDWDPVPGAKYYELRVARDADFNTIIDNVTPVYGTRYSPATTYNNAQYYWQVRAVDLAGLPTAWTTVQNSFSRVWPDQPQPVWPLGDVSSPQPVEGEPYFQWTPVQHASLYQIQVGTDENFSPGSFDECTTAGTTYTVGNMTITGQVRSAEKCELFAGQTTYWRVRALDLPFKSATTSGVQGLYSTTQAVVWQDHFITSMTPSSGDLVDIPTLTWDGLRPAEKYTVELHNEAGALLKKVDTYATSYTPVGMGALPAGLYTWTVQAVDARSSSSLIYEAGFEVSGVVPEPAGDPLTPLSGRSGDPATMKAPLLSWEPMPGASYYKVQIGSANSGTWYVGTSADVIDKRLPYPQVTDTSKRFFAPGDYIWRVSAYNNADALLGSSTIETFHIAGFPAVEGQSIAIDGTTLDAAAGCTAHLDPNGVSGAQCDRVPTSPVLSWDRIPGISHYIVYVSNDSSFTNLLEATVPGTTSTRYALTTSNTEPTYPDSQAGKSYFWFIRPCKAIGGCGPSPVSVAGMATNAFRKVSPAIVLQTPVDDADPADPNVDTSEVTFTWDDYFDTSQATVWDETGELGPEAAQLYRIQVDDSPTFATPLDDVKVDQTTYTAVKKLYPEGQLYWRVQALDGDGKGLSWSQTRAFVKRSAPVVLDFPIDDATVSGTAAFRWQPQPFNASYRIEVYRNNDTTFSSANRLFYKDVTTTAYSWDQPIPASTQPYVWRVRGKDPSGNWLPWATTGRFYSTGAAPSLLEPLDASLESANGPLFTWTSVAGASSYQIEIRTATAQWLKTPTAATAYATTQAVPDGTLTWRVTALDPRGNPLGSSEWRSFRVDAAAPKVVSHNPTSTPRLSSNFRVKFSEPVSGVSGNTMKLFLKGRKGQLAATVTLDSTGTKAVLNPSANLKPGKTYTVRLTSGIKDVAGNGLVPFRWSVTT